MNQSPSGTLLHVQLGLPLQPLVLLHQLAVVWHHIWKGLRSTVAAESLSGLSGPVVTKPADRWHRGAVGRVLDLRSRGWGVKAGMVCVWVAGKTV